MKFNVKMLAFEDNKVRVVEVPDSDCSVQSLLDKIYHWGQNDFQPQLCCSVSVGDVIKTKAYGSSSRWDSSR